MAKQTTPFTHYGRFKNCSGQAGLRFLTVLVLSLSAVTLQSLLWRIFPDRVEIKAQAEPEAIAGLPTTPDNIERPGEMSRVVWGGGRQ